jgi:hypothetical protein
VHPAAWESERASSFVTWIGACGEVRLTAMMRDKDTARSKRVTDEMLKMVKFDIVALEKAYRG